MLRYIRTCLYFYDMLFHSSTITNINYINNPSCADAYLIDEHVSSIADFLALREDETGFADCLTCVKLNLTSTHATPRE